MTTARWERWIFNGLSVVVAISGVSYLYMKYAMRTEDPFAVVNHPLQPSMLAVHVVAAPCLVLVFGMLLRSHVMKKLMSTRQSNRRAGWTSLLSFAVMALSGYLLQVMTAGLGIMVVVHVASGLLFVVGYGVHVLIGMREHARIDAQDVASSSLSGVVLHVDRRGLDAG